MEGAAQNVKNCLKWQLDAEDYQFEIKIILG